jgi:cobalt-zinc-cadmium efflux system outer membrane protein
MGTRLPVLGLLLVLLVGPVRAQPELTLSQALAQAEQKNPSLAAKGLAPRVAEGDLVQAGMTPNPVLSLQTDVENLSLIESVGLNLQQELELGGKRQARLAVAQARLDQARFQQAEARRQLRLDVKVAFFELLYQQRVVSVRREALTLSEETLELTRKRLSLGDVAGLDVIQLEAEVARRRSSLAQSEGQRASQAAELARLLGSPEQTALVVTGELTTPSAEISLATLREQALKRPDLEAAQANLSATQANIGLQEANGVANLTVSGGLSRERLFIDGDAVSPAGLISSIDDRSWVASVQLSLPLPINNTNEGNILKARAEAEQAVFERESLQQKVFSEVTRAHVEWEAARAARLPLTEIALDRSRQALELTNRAYNLGARSLLNVFQARQDYVEAHLAELSAAREEALSRARLEAAVGNDLFPEEVP